MNLRDIHTPVLLDRCVELLAPALQADGAVLVDATLGMGGHSEALLARFPNIRLIGLDRDTDALRIAGERLARFRDRVTLVHTVYDEIGLHAQGASGILFDLGVSSLQLDEAERGFAYSKDAPLDMRMDQTKGVTAADVIATYSEGNLRRIFERYGEEKLAGRYARFIIAARQKQPITRSGELVEILIAATPAAAQRAGHPAKRVFQALRIEVNTELNVLADAIPSAMDALGVGGRIVVMSYQSLEDRLVKQAFAAASASTAPAGLPVELPEHAPRFRILTKGAELADDEERARNPRAIPVRLRAAEKLRESA
ncbi:MULTISPECIES: 16S rRNA (cytosine(1402)-N(4))-methyltransferase RsmH [unclassified Microbacterium]|jgi:16S rRNA (cytosine1402-N4)-methyltransferase|uniref:16S rRNA (cytosine(1402)-N(4))-methyltransferase RsmH n=1 Tax=unclassified Microbacterium TaxID=2609290 RepID=UPI0004121F6B|nr:MULTISPECIES: 16S rRNA (cytosine(1402)-N(4))-methyltransferase RsmH [unclassified Microbacterium]PQZ60456.1 16S rRNA (cytosine(1402)-N(4))-methyltransferase RsmH [Microbacterium sp. MYb43]PQZ81882.1 16S rRNA (cytosine(1402)-N(4))-methyltransferase RsmH [Microbacterium sp. MYb40]PRB22145.1 16S rRNA (cytosine(1402)-N(4))-methyltransferase RsmH [Microbacterium sp. MYb54]PRB31290.1 16S rRNA (cytosine(1402)-N(4))-methyltransferase RsmH [Microbacterium sp. MYb50]PRB69899.1 16S rRNA (cytosine(1402